MYSRIRQIILDLLFPPCCMSCEAPLPGNSSVSLLCSRCKDQLHTRSAFSCAKCSRRIPTLLQRCHNDSFAVAALCDYTNPTIHNLIAQLKFRKRPQALDCLKLYLEDYLRPLAAEFANYILVPVPLHKKRLRERGFNQSELIARTLNEILGLPLYTDVLLRTLSTKPQTKTADRKERALNVAGCFTLTHPEKIQGKNILLIDDVLTTGATLSEAAATLRDSGTKKIVAFVLART